MRFDVARVPVDFILEPTTSWYSWPPDSEGSGKVIEAEHRAASDDETARQLEVDLQATVVDFVAKVFIPAYLLYLLFIGVEVWTDHATPFLVIQIVCVTTMVLGVWVVRTARLRNLVLVYGLTGLAVLSLFHFGPLLGTGLFYMLAVLLSTFLLGVRHSFGVVGVLCLAVLAPPVLGVGPERVELMTWDWVRVMLSTSVSMIVAMFLFHRTNRAFEESLHATVEASDRERALEDERRRLFEAAMQMQRLESLGRLSGEVAHEFNNALVAVRGGIDLLEPSVDEKGQEVLDMMAEGIDAATTTARSLLDFARHQSSETNRVDVCEVAAGVCGRFQALVGSKIELRTDLDCEATVELSQDDLEQVLLNLLMNAMEAIPRRGSIDVRCSNDGRRVTLEVRDSGVGMGNEAVARVFEPFFTTKTEDGTGLGLAVVWGHVTRAGGTVRVASELDVGTTFTVDLPVVTGSDALEAE